MELIIKDVTKNYGKYNILKGININYKGPGLICFVGPSGSGKSTLLNMIGGLDTVTSGEIIINGINVTELNAKEIVNYRNHHLGFVFQDFFLIKHLNVLDNIMLSGLMSGNKRDIVSVQAIELIQKLGLTGKENQFPNKLSGGEKQRVAIGRALINEPEIIFADEPTGNLDKKNSENVFQMLKEISKDKLVIIVTHDLELAKLYSDKIYQMSDGKIVNHDDYKNQEHDKTKITNKNISLSIKTICILAYRHLFSKRGRLLSVLISLVISLTFLSLLLNLKIGAEKMVNHFYETNFNVNLVKTNEKSVITKDNFLYSFNFVNEEKITKVKNISHVKDVVVSYQDILESISLNYNGKEYNDAAYEVFNVGDYFKTRFENLNIIDHVPINENEIILSMDMAKEIEGDLPKSLIGKNMTITYNNETVKIVGISKLPFSYYSSNLIYRMLLSVDYNNMGIIALTTEEYNDIFIKKVTNNYSEDNSNVLPVIIISKNDFKENLIFGYVPQQNDEVIISSSLFTSLTNILPNHFTDWKNDDIYIINPLFGNKNIVKVSGIYESDKNEVILNDSIINSLTKPNGTSIHVFVDNYKNVSDVTHRIDLLGLQSDASGFSAIDSLKNTLRLTEITLGIFIGITSIISVIIIFSIVSSNVAERTNEIGILKALGAKNHNIINLFNIEAMITSMLAIVITLLLTLILNPIANYIFNNHSKVNFPLFTFSFKNLIILFLLSNFITIISGFIPSYKASRLKPVDALRK